MIDIIGTKDGEGMDVETFLREMGNRISTRRRQLKMTQEALAEQMDVSVPTISYIETGRNAIRPENLAKLCEALDVSADYILLGRTSPLEAGRVAEKLDGLPHSELTAIETIIDQCLLLANKPVHR